MSSKTTHRLFSSVLIALSFSVAHAGGLDVSSPNASTASLTLTGAGFSQFVFNATISANTTNYNLKSAALTAGWDGVKPLIATVTVNSGVYVGSTATNTYAFDTGTGFTANSVLKLINNGFIVGKGGNGGTGGYGNFGACSSGTAGGAGGPALLAQAPLDVTNNGTIGGGGGGGGGHAGTRNYWSGNAQFNPHGGGGGGGGQGYTGSSGGGGNSGTMSSGGAGSGGTTTAPGSGTTPNGFVGATGGALGQPGGTGGYNTAADAIPSDFGVRGGTGGAAGAAVVGNTNISWTKAGTRLGALQ